MNLTIVGNWKMNLDFVEAVHLTQQIGVVLRNQPLQHVALAVVPPFVDLRSVRSVIESEKIPLSLGAQHVHPAENGAFTGEVSVGMLKRLGTDLVLVGHSERRSNFAMTDDVVTTTTAAVTRQGLTALVCCGESAATREAGEAVPFVQEQIRSALREVKPNDRDRVIVAYEPIWAIGTGAAATTDDVAAMIAAIRTALAEEGFTGTPVLYGGSVNGDNAAEILDARVDGFLVGGASLRADSFLAIARAGDDWYALHGA